MKQLEAVKLSKSASQAIKGGDGIDNTQPGDGKRFKGRGPIQLS